MSGSKTILLGRTIMIKKIKDWYKNWKHKRAIKKRLKELQEKDPFTYD
jgi:hypothetical protein